MPEESLTRKPARFYRDLLKRGAFSAGSTQGFEGFESLESTVSSEPDLSDAAINEHLGSTKAELYRIIKDYLGDQPALYQTADQLLETGGEALRILRSSSDEDLADRGDVMDGLEAIVRTDGSRPSFMIREGNVDLTTSPASTWENSVNESNDLLRDAFNCVGRIDVPGSPQGFQGTGFLIHENLIITNRHVLQVTANSQQDGSWRIKPGATIDFGHEFRARQSLNPRPLRRVVFAGAKPIVGLIDHTKLDLALIELEPADAAARPSFVLSVDSAPDWSQPQLPIYIVGYPGSPGPGVAPPTLLEQLFKSTFGHKRLAPGLLMTAQQNVHTWTVAHDATTLGGNSGSVIFVIGREHVAAGLHYGGRWADPRENWGHVLGLVLDQSGGGSDKTLRDHFEEFGVELVDRM